MQDFVHLHTHSHYSLLSALPKVKELVARAKRENMSALALTDNGNLYGAIEFYKACVKEKIKPIIGVDCYVANRTRHDKEPGIDNRRYRIVLLAKNNTGYKNLIKLVTAAHLEGFYYKPRIDRKLMERHAEGLIALLPAFAGEHIGPLKADHFAEAEEIVKQHSTLYGADSCYLEITHHPEIDGQEKVAKNIITLAEKTGTPLVATNDVYYLNPEDRDARQILLSIQSGGERRAFGDDNADFSFLPAHTLQERFAHLPEALENTKRIADACSLSFELGTWMFPNIAIESGRNADDELAYLAESGIKKRGLKRTPQLVERMEYELSVIKDKGFARYFLVVADLLRFAREHSILSTIRGSVAGSLVTYLAGITTINPLEYKLPFERFLNPERPKAPDIDMDFADNRRDEVIAYAREKYGVKNVAQIGTFGTMLARGSVRDTARALGYDYTTGDQIAKLIPFGRQGFPVTIDSALESEPDLAALYKQDADTKRVIDTAKKIEGRVRHISVHAAGVVISPIPLDDVVPVQRDPKGAEKVITQYDMHAVEDIGLTKFDFLGLKNLAILSDVVRRVKKIYDKDVDLDALPIDDEKTFAMLARGETLGVFQMASSGMTRYLKELKPTDIHDINAMVALYRPGPMESIPSYIERKHNPARITFLDERLKDILDRSHGVITYQDDVLLIAIRIAGYSWLEADKLRKAMGKKIPAEMAQQKEKFLTGCVGGGMTERKADTLWRLIEPFAAYGFNKAHAASYGRVAYQTAYMKAHFPTAYMASVLTADAGDTDKIAEVVGGCKRMGIPVLPPDVNESFGDFSVVTKEMIDTPEEKIRFGLHSIKNFGDSVADTIIAERKKNGPYESLADFLERVRDRNLNKKSLEALIKCGALDSFGERGELLANRDNLLDYNRLGEQLPESQDSLFTLMPDDATLPELTLAPAAPASPAESLMWEKELLGLYVSGHPLDAHKEKMLKKDTSIRYVKEELKPGMRGVVYGLIENCRVIVTKNNQKMAFARLSDYTGTIEVVVFPKHFDTVRDLLEEQVCIGVRGRVSDRNGETSLVAEAMKPLAETDA